MVWDMDIPAGRLEDAWKRAQRDNAAGKLQWNTVRGPAAAILLTMPELEWPWIHPLVFQTNEAIQIDLRRHCPRDVQAMAIRDCNRVAWSKWCDHPRRKHLAPAPLVAPLQAWCRLRDKTTQSAALATTAKAVADGLLTQSEVAR